eukprot:COSAG01_NODE_26917_length_699_cov_1.290000_1_plen_140_part_10
MSVFKCRYLTRYSPATHLKKEEDFSVQRSNTYNKNRCPKSLRGFEENRPNTDFTLYVASEPGGRSCGFERLTGLGFKKLPDQLAWGGGCCKGVMSIYTMKVKGGGAYTLPKTTTGQCVGSIFFKDYASQPYATVTGIKID